jgi:methionyl-tRNA formyltransferase
MRTLFIGGTKRGYLTLKALIESGAEVVGLLSLQQDEHEMERFEAPIKALAERNAIPYYETKWMKDRDYAEIIAQEIQPEIALVVGCRILIPAKIVHLPPLGTLAVHDSLLPEYRGFAPINWSILNGEDSLGVTLFYLNELMDGGDIVAKKTIPISSGARAPEVYNQVIQATIDLILEAYPLLVKGLAPRIPQNYTAGSFTCSRTPGDGLIDWTQPTQRIFNQIRALTYPYPGAFSFYAGKKLLVWRAEPLDNPPHYVGRIPGRVIGRSPSTGSIDVLTGNGVLRILEVQLDGQEKTAAAKVIRSVRGSLGVQMTDLLGRIQSLESEVARLKSGKNHQPVEFSGEAMLSDGACDGEKEEIGKS